VVLRFEAGIGRRPDLLDQHVVLVGLAVGDGFVRDVRDAEEQLVELVLDLLELRFELPQLVCEHAHGVDLGLSLLRSGAPDLLARPVLFGAPLLDAGLERAQFGVELEDAVECVGCAPACECGPVRVRVLADGLQVEHALQHGRSLGGTCRSSLDDPAVRLPQGG
jgi:hypothetical protein